jgi:hypothetical protein
MKGVFCKKLSNNRLYTRKVGSNPEKYLIFQKSVIDFAGELRYTDGGAKWSKMAAKWSGGEAHDR